MRNTDSTPSPPPAPVRLAAAALLVTGCGGQPSAPQGGEEPASVLLVSVDTLQRDHVSCYGYFRDTTPTIDSLAAEGVLFEEAAVSMATTLPSHLTMLTGLYAHQHGVKSNGQGLKRPFRSEPGRFSLASLLAAEGYATAAFLSASVLASPTGIDAGFETFDAPAAGDRVSTLEASERVGAPLAWLAEHAATEPFFLWVHFFDPHSVNEPKAPYDTLFRSDERLRAWLQERDIDLSSLVELFGDSPGILGRFLALRQGEGVRWSDIEDLCNRYDGDLRNVDDRIAELLDALERLGCLDRTIVCVVGDHGQALGEDGWFGHARILETTTFTPWILRLPPGMLDVPRRETRLVTLADLAPTLVARLPLAGGQAFLAQAEGEDVLDPSFARPHVLTEQKTKRIGSTEFPSQTALLTDRWQYVRDKQGWEELYDRDAVGVDLSASQPEVMAELRDVTRAILQRRRAIEASEEEPTSEETAELMERLRELGYTGEEDE